MSPRMHTLLPSGSPAGSRRSILVLVLVGAGVLSACAPEDATPRRVVLVTLDTLRADAFGDGEHAAMPHTAAWAESGTRFTSYYTASPVTQPAHASLLTGLHPWQHGVTRNGLVLPSGLRTVPEILRAAGWRTDAVVASFPLERRMGLDQGFDRYLDRFEHRMGESWNDIPVEEFYTLAGGVTDRALEILDETEASCHFLWVHYFDPHAPYGDTTDVEPSLFHRFRDKIVAGEPGADEILLRARELYRRDVLSLDTQLARLLERLAADAESVETHVVLVSDHGESFGEDGSLGHGRRLTDPQIRVPLVVRSPRLAAGVCTDPVGSVDVAATLLALAGSEERLPHGRDLAVGADASGSGPSDASGPEPREEAAPLVTGMRSTFAEPLLDPRTDGPPRRIAGPRWFVVEDGVIYSGGAEGVWRGDDESAPAPPEVAERLARLFARFARETTEAPARDDAETRTALDKLGYAE